MNKQHFLFPRCRVIWSQRKSWRHWSYLVACSFLQNIFSTKPQYYECMIFIHILNLVPSFPHLKTGSVKFNYSKCGVHCGPYIELSIGLNMLSCVGNYHLWESQRSWNVWESYIVHYICEGKSCFEQLFLYHNCGWVNYFRVVQQWLLSSHIIGILVIDVALVKLMVTPNCI